MQKTIISSLVVAGLLVSSSMALATTDNKYPAANFQPKVIYIDKEAVSSAPKAKKSEAATTVAAASKKTPFDPKYPAASFEPKVIYP